MARILLGRNATHKNNCCRPPTQYYIYYVIIFRFPFRRKKN